MALAPGGGSVCTKGAGICLKGEVIRHLAQPGCEWGISSEDRGQLILFGGTTIIVFDGDRF